MTTAEHCLPVQNEMGETPIWVPEELFRINASVHGIVEPEFLG